LTRNVAGVRGPFQFLGSGRRGVGHARWPFILKRGWKITSRFTSERCNRWNIEPDGLTKKICIHRERILEKVGTLFSLSNSEKSAEHDQRALFRTIALKEADFQISACRGRNIVNT
jgi:hypothetical protein